ncbi:TonB-dependent receptor [Sandaracinobacter sp. RS1-74]|uniref:TonB-dependent siderophore receptor n=1 Tax=Sandaracinobacteroides sayramensis TaxID=2913411 RepID=UPI001EDC84E5|nr:TonB-dependent receptor [Sandaracinobacteroides sayramensis]MCG2840687.1 TonB-dependent receptor [Sandaracinobacteroides sayramensis]
MQIAAIDAELWGLSMFSTNEVSRPAATRANRAGRIAWLMLGVSAVTAIAANPAAAQDAATSGDQSVRFDISAQSLDGAITAFGLQSGLRVSADQALLAGLQSSGVSGNFTPAEALSRLLTGTGVTFRWVDGRSVALESAPQMSSSGGNGSITLGPVRVEGEGSGRGSGTVRPPADTRGTYTVPATNSATRLDLAIKDTPQVVNVITRQRIEDQNLVQIADVMAQQPGVTVQQQGVPGMGKVNYHARGFPVTNVMFDGVLTNGSGNDNFTLWGVIDTAVFDRIEMVQGSTGLSSGVGDPSGAVNFIRKRPTEELQAEGTLSYGSWERLRGTVDVTGPLTGDGRIRGRLVGAYNQGGNWQDRVDYKMGTAYGIVEADAADSLLLTAGLLWTKIKIDDAAIFGMTAAGQSTVSSDRFLTATLGRHYNPATQWSEGNVEFLNPFAKAEWRFADNWRLNASYMFSKVRQERIVGVIGQQIYDPANDIADFTWARLDQRGQLHNADLSVSGKFEALGQQHQITFGGSLYSGHIINGRYNNSSSQPISMLGFTRLAISQWNNGDVPFPSYGAATLPFGPSGIPNFLTYDPLHFDFDAIGAPDDKVKEKQYAAYIGAQLRPIERVQLILGGRWNYWERQRVAYSYDYTQLILTGQFNWQEDERNSYKFKVSGEFTPYAGLIFDVTKAITAYVSYTGINKANVGFGDSVNGTGWPLDINGDPLPPISGNSWEIGAKAGFFDNRLNVQLTGYRMKQKNYPSYSNGVVEGCTYDPLAGYCMGPAIAGAGIISKGIDFNVSGQITDRINISASYSYLDLKMDRVPYRGSERDVTAYCETERGDRNFNCPEHSIKIFGTWQPIDKLTLGAGGTWKSATSAVQGSGTIEPAVLEAMSQGSFAVVDAMARYRITPRFSLSVNVNNIFDETYLTTQDYYSGFYGAPRNVVVSLTAKY